MTSAQQLVLELYKLKWEEPDLDFHEVMRRLYVDDKKTLDQIAKELYLSKSTIVKWLKQEGITMRKMIWV